MLQFLTGISISSSIMVSNLINFVGLRVLHESISQTTRKVYQWANFPCDANLDPLKCPSNITTDFLKTPMIFVTYPDHGCVYTLSQEDGDELYYAPINSNGNVNLEEFAPVDLDGADMDEMELFDIRNRLRKLVEV